MSDIFPSLVSTEWLAAHLAEPGIAVLDASRHLPAAKRDPQAEFAAAHIPGARFLDLAALVDDTSSTPQAPASPRTACRGAGPAGRGRPAAASCFYDDSAVRTSARAWFMLTACGWKDVAILDGGLAKMGVPSGERLDSGLPDIRPRPARAPRTAESPCAARPKCSTILKRAPSR